MKHINILMTALACTGMLTASCISEEPLNMECDIEEVVLNVENPTTLFYHDYDATQQIPSTADSVRFEVKSTATVGSLPVSLRITPGATAYLMGEVVPFENGTSLDFSNGRRQTFRIISEDGQWDRYYRIFIEKEQTSEGNLFFPFDEYALDATGKYYEWQAEGNAASFFTDGKWKNGNPGFKLSRSSAKPEEYPSTPVVGGGPDGSDCVKLETCSTGSFGAMVNMRIASGSFFNGVFDVSNALKDALKATRFGSPFKQKPVSVSAWMKFEPGEMFQNRTGAAVEGVTDEPDFYAIVYRNTDADGNAVMLDGNDVLTSPHIVGIARLPHHYNADGSDLLSSSPIHGITNEWQEVTLTLRYSEELDPEVLANNGYSFVISFASSWQGAYFQGAVGSKLWIDNVRVITE